MIQALSLSLAGDVERDKERASFRALGGLEGRRSRAVPSTVDTHKFQPTGGQTGPS
jgi:hypothetical protein